MNEIPSKATNVVVLYFVTISVAWDIFGSTKSIPSQSEMFAESGHRKGRWSGRVQLLVGAFNPPEKSDRELLPQILGGKHQTNVLKIFLHCFKHLQNLPTIAKLYCKKSQAPALLWAHQAHSPRPDRCWANVFWILLDERSTRQMAGRRIHRDASKRRWMLPAYWCWW